MVASLGLLYLALYHDVSHLNAWKSSHYCSLAGYMLIAGAIMMSFGALALCIIHNNGPGNNGPGNNAIPMSEIGTCVHALSLIHI